MIGLLVASLKKVYGADMPEENLDFIAKALVNKGATSREVICNYFLNDFMKDPIEMYCRLFKSGKQDCIKTLVCMHRWNADNQYYLSDKKDFNVGDMVTVPTDNGITTGIVLAIETYTTENAPIPQTEMLWII